MKSLFLLGIAALSILGGCRNGKCGGDNPVVSPTVITNEKQGTGVPVLPIYTPWWVEG